MLKQYGLGISHLYTHTHWLNVRDGKSGTVDQLNTMQNQVQNVSAVYLAALVCFQGEGAVLFERLDFVRPQLLLLHRFTASEKHGQMPSRRSEHIPHLENAKKACKSGLLRFSILPEKRSTHSQILLSAKGQRVTLQNAPLFSSDSAKTFSKKISGTYYIYDGKALCQRQISAYQHCRQLRKNADWQLRDRVCFLR